MCSSGSQKNAMLAELGLESYMGVPLRDAEGRVLGIMSIFNDAPMDQHDQHREM